MERHPPGPHHPRNRARADAPGSAPIVATTEVRRVADDAPDAAPGAMIDGASAQFGEGVRAIHPELPVVRITANERRRGPKCRAVGELGDEPESIAKRVQQLACTADVIVWAHDDKIFVASADAAAKVLAELTIGVYGAGVLLAEIEDDIEKFRRGTR